jgi:SNF2 family DNA or RNA helicase
MFIIDAEEKNFLISFKYRPELVELIKKIPGRKWNPDIKKWVVPAWPESIAELKKLALVPTPAAQKILTDGEVKTMSPSEIPDIDIISKTDPPLWKHQRRMIAWAAHNKRALWHCGMGTGKTRAAVDFIQTSGVKKILVACPLAVCRVWEKQVQMFAANNINCIVLDKKSVAEKQQAADRALNLSAITGDPCLIVINYESAWRDPFGAWALKQKFDLIIEDECQNLKSPGGRASRYFHKLSKSAERVLGLSGTPLPHSPLDAYSVFRAMDDSIFGTSFTRFRARYAVMGGFQNKQVVAYVNQDEMSRKIDTIRIHVSRDVLDLPGAVHIEQTFALPDAAQKIYKNLEDDFYARVDSGEVTTSNALTKLLRLQQITSGYLPLDLQEGADEENRKYETLHNEKSEQLKTILDGLEPDEPVVVFCRFRNDLKAVHDVCFQLGRKSMELSGSIKQLAEWQDGQVPVLAVQIRTGREGVDLTRACYCVYFSLGFSLNDYEQSLARIHRPGQARSCFYYHLIAENTVDRKVYAALKERKAVIESILNSKGGLNGN